MTAPTATADSCAGRSRGAIRFDRNELSGAFGDLGTDLPLLVGMILAARLDSASVLILFGAMQVLTALRYRMPMPVQPLKAMAAIVISQKIAGSVLYAAGLTVGITMLLLSVTGLLDWISRLVPKTVVRGIQFGLGLQLAGIALGNYVRADGNSGYWLAAAGFAITIFLYGNRRFPSGLFLVALGVAYAFAFKVDAASMVHAAGFRLPAVRTPAAPDLVAGFLLLALPQIPLSLANSILATRQLAEDLFPERRVSVRTIGITYSVMNLINPFFGGVPTCHGAGGMAGHYTFGGRTGGSVILYGSLYLVLGLFFSAGFEQVIQVFPMPVLGVLLFFEGLALMKVIRDIAADRADLSVALLVGLTAGTLPYGYVVALIIGLILTALTRRGLVDLAK